MSAISSTFVVQFYAFKKKKSLYVIFVDIYDRIFSNTYFSVNFTEYAGLL